MSANPAFDQKVTPESPWLGLRSFTEESRRFFYGRSAECDDLYERILDKSLTILFGQSGLGKSSLIKAGLVPRLQDAGLLPISIRLDHSVAATLKAGGTPPMRENEAASLDAPPPTEQLIQRLAAALAETGFAAQAAALSPEARARIVPPVDAGTFLWLVFHDPIYGFVPDPRQPELKVPRPVFIIDQFEEIFTVGDKERRRAGNEAFREALASLVENRPPPALRERLEEDDELNARLDYRARPPRVLLSLREDFLSMLERWRRSIPSLMENRFELRMLRGPQAFEAVVRPGQVRDGLPIIPDDVGEAIVRFVANAGKDKPLAEIDAVPPLLSLVCAELNAQRLTPPVQSQITSGQFEGKSDGILKSFYNRSFELASYGAALEGLPDAAAALAALQASIELRLLSADGYRENVAYDTIHRDLSGAASKATAARVLEQIVERRLVTADERGGVRRLELAHDVLAPIVKASRDERQKKEALANAVLERERAEKDLQRAEEEKRRAERQKEEAEKQRNHFLAVAVVAVLFALAAGAGGWFAWQKTWDAEASKMKADHATDRAERNERRAKKSAADAEKSAAQARENLALATQITEGVVSQSSAKLSRYSGMQTLRSEIVEQTLKSFATLAAQAPDDVAVRATSARANLEAMLAKIEVDRAVKNLAPLLKALEAVNQAALAQPDNSALEIYTLNAVNAVYRFSLDSGARDTARELVLSYLDRAKKRAADPQAPPEAHLAYARLLNGAANVEGDNKRRAELYMESIEAFKPCHALAATDSDYFRAYCSPRINLSDRVLRAGDREHAERLTGELLGMCKTAMGSIGDQPPALETIVYAYHWASDVEAGKPEDAATALQAALLAEDAVDAGLALIRANPRSSKYLGLVAEAQKKLAQRLESKFLPDYRQRKAGYYYQQAALNELRAAQAAPDNAQLWIAAARSLTTVTTKLGESDSPEAAEYFDKRLQVYGEAAQLPGLDAEDWTSLASCFYQYSQYLDGRKKTGDAYRVAMDGLAAYVTHPSVQKWQGEEWFQIGLSESIDAAAKQIEGAEKSRTALPRFAKALSLLEKPVNRARASAIIISHINVARSHLKEGHLDEALRVLLRAKAILATQSATPKHYYLVSAERSLHQTLADCYEKQYLPKPAYEALHAYATALWGFYGKKPPEAKPADAENLKALRKEIADFKTPPMRRFTVQCDQNGTKVPMQVYLTDYVEDGVQPLGNQLSYLEELSMKVPKEVLDHFARLYKIAVENNVSFIDLAVYVRDAGGADPTKMSSQQELEKLNNQMLSAQAETRDRLLGELRGAEAKNIDLIRREIAAAQKKLELEASTQRLSTLTGLFDRQLDLAVQSISRDRALALSSIASGRQTLIEMEVESTEASDVRRWRSRILEVEEFVREKLKSGEAASAKQDTAEQAAQARQRAALRQVKEAEDRFYAAQGSAVEKASLANKLTNASFTGFFVRRWIDSEQSARRAVEIDHANALAWGNLGTALLFQGRYDAALEIYRKYWYEKAGEFPSVAANTYDDFERLKKVGITHPDIEKLKSALPKPDEILKAQKEVQERLTAYLAKVKDAEAAFQASASDETRTELARKLSNASFAAMFLKRWPESEQLARRAVELDPPNVMAWGNLATALLFQDKYAGALEIYRKYWHENASSDTMLAAGTYDDFEQLKKLGITHPDIAKLKDALPTPGLLKARKAAREKLQENLAKVKEAEEANRANPSAATRAALAAGWSNASYSALYVQRWADSEQWARRSVELDPGSAFTWGNLATALLFQGKYDAALEIYDKHWHREVSGFSSLAASIYDDFNLLAKLSITHADIAKLKAGLVTPEKLELRQAEARLTDLLAKANAADETYRAAPTDANKIAVTAAWSKASYSALFAQRWTDSETWARKSVEIYPANIMAWGNVGTALLFQGKYDAALEIYRKYWNEKLEGFDSLAASIYDDFERLAKVNIKHADIAKLKAALPTPERLVAQKAEARLTDHLTTVKEAEEAYAKSPTEENKIKLAGKWSNAAFNGFFARRWTDSEQWARKSAEILPTNAIAWGNLATALLFQGKYNEALEIYRKYWNREISSFSSLAASIYDDFDRLAKQSITHADIAKLKAALPTPEQMELQKAEARLTEYLARANAADEMYRADPSTVPKTSLAARWANAAYTGFYAKRWVDAEQWARRAVELDPASPLAQSNLATALLYQGKYNEALEIYRVFWDRDMSGFTSLAASIYDDFNRLEKQRITHPDVAKLKAALPTPERVIVQKAEKEVTTSLARAKTAEEAYSASPTEANKSSLSDRWSSASFHGFFVKRWADSETWARKSVEINPANAMAWGNLATALLFQGKYDAALEIYRKYWNQEISGFPSVGAGTYDDFERLEKVGITHPDIVKLKAALPKPPKAAPASAPR